MTWPKVRIDSLCEVTSSKRIFAADYTDEGVPFYRAKEISEKHNGALSVSSELFISRSYFETLRNKFGAPKPGDLLLTSIGALLGEPYVVKHGEEFYFKDGNLTWFRKLGGIDSHFLYYWMISPQGKGELERAKIGSAQPAFTIMLLKQMVVDLPPLPVQERIVAILSSYDDLIENNTRRIKILEGMAQMLYREWFVNFRFPGHEKVRMVESELGPIPEGWTVRNLFDVADVTYGFPFKSKLFTAGGEGIPVIRIRDIKSDFSNTFTTETAEAKHIVKNGDLLVGMDGDFHMGKWAGGNAYLNQRVVRFRPKDCLSPYFLFLALEAPINHFDSTIVGTTVAHLSDRDLRSTNLLMPSDDIQKKTSAVFDPLLSMEIGLKLKIANLRTTRDLLLPKLISGEVPVEAAAELMEQTA